MSLFERWANRQLREDCDALRSQLQVLRADHMELLERFLRLQGKLAKRGELTAGPDGDGTRRTAVQTIGAAGAAAPVSAQAEDLQRRILDRRRARVPS